MKQKKIWIDTDLSVGMKRHKKEGYCDVDDGFAVLQLIKAKTIEIAGMSAVFGNTPIENSYPLCQKMNSDFAGGKIPVFKGAGEAMNLSDLKTNAAVEALAETLKTQELHILAIGPATNIGLLLLLYPERAKYIKEIVLVAGRRKHTDHFELGNKGTCAQDLNFDLDNDAFRVLFESGVKVVLCPFEVSSKVWITDGDLKLLEQGDSGNQWLAKQSQPWLAQWIHLGAKGFNPFDVLASHYLIAPEDLIAEELNAHLEIHPDDTVMDMDKKIFKQYLICDKSAGFSVTYCYDVVPDFHEKLMNSFN